ncbi:MAG: UDP-N-acetylglucosamine 2-epimerase (non-hydrolyzing) [Balneola sp.]|nr:UDP-N-acetylglucosamine 2-epimerase (non-hydrolyzing) [Balneola sp.]MBO6650158.1 UDP-N-acetylglucosamine 2-epimerase (non-hydrolyzing) [Balneola sp.]MBO6710521.1 UDP-N-acetylglucosamine 2-epimerase (non-hydrolyzing) [Balneola sp.]MBO6799206.1 UDP-N-acetylglucosamine 2-epimerase (non-hydrolyzing) [Balneola sp.]MBO6871045.1 UDP-N-acetylglucosamine 2-epimerase (non-hydrolyzing) [Balneola sp.]
MKKIVVAFGTRPEIIKLAPLIHELESAGKFNVVKVHTGQHDGLAVDMMKLFGISPDHNLRSMASASDLFELSEFLLPKLKKIMTVENPDAVIVQGDTTSSYLSAMAAFYLKIPVYHVEAGLRSFDVYNPFPEEINRKQISTVAGLHFAPTDLAVQNLINEGINESVVFNTGNTVIDALHRIRNSELFANSKPEILNEIKPSQKLILVTTHRRENLGEPLAFIMKGLIEILESDQSRTILLPGHPNPKVQEILRSNEFRNERLRIIEPMDYLTFQHVLDRSDLVLTDSGGIQEEAAALGKKLLVLRKTTERQELVKSGYTKLVGSDTKLISKEADKMLSNSDSEIAYNPYGNGDASKKIAEIIQSNL